MPRWMRWVLLGLVVVAIVVVWLARGQPRCGPRGRQERQAAVLAWLECVECTDGEREAVVAQGRCPVTALEDALLNGPGPGRLANVRRRLELSSVPTAPLSLNQLVQIGVDGYATTYQFRATVALADLADSGVDRAREALLGARDSATSGTRTFPWSVLRALEAAAAQASIPAFAGQVAPATADFLDTVTVRLPPGGVVDDDSVRLVGSPFGDDVLLERFTGSDSLWFVAAGDVGSYVLTILGLGSDDDSARADFTIDRMPPRPQGLGAEVPIPLGQLPFRHYFAVGDTAEQLQLQVAAPTAVALSLEWADSVGARLVVRQCTVPFGVIPLPSDPVRRVRGRVVDESGTEVGQLSLRVAGLPPVLTAASGAFEVSVPPGPDTVSVEITGPDHEHGRFVLPVGTGLVTLGVRTRAHAAAPGALRRLVADSVGLTPGCWLLGVDREGPPTDAHPTIFRVKVTAVP